MILLRDVCWGCLWTLSGRSGQPGATTPSLSCERSGVRQRSLVRVRSMWPRQVGGQAGRLRTRRDGHDQRRAIPCIPASSRHCDSKDRELLSTTYDPCHRFAHRVLHSLDGRSAQVKASRVNPEPARPSPDRACLVATPRRGDENRVATEVSSGTACR
jgi:hypothetical protein